MPNESHPDTDANMMAEVHYFHSTIELAMDAREFVLRKDAPDIAFAIPSLVSEAAAFLKKNNWNVELQNNVNFTFFAFDLTHVDPLLLETMKYIIQPADVVERSPHNLGEPVKQLSLYPSALPISNKYIETPKAERAKLIERNLDKLGISNQQRRTLNLLVFSAQQAKQFDTVAQTLKPYGIDLNAVSAEYKQRKEMFAAGKAQGLIVSWFTSTFDPSTTPNIANWTATQYLPDEQLANMQALIEKAQILPDGEREKTFAKAEEILINEGGLIPLFRSYDRVLFRNHLCGVKGSPTLIFPTMWIRNCGS